jgi:hypothetical protein
MHWKQLVRMMSKSWSGLMPQRQVREVFESVHDKLSWPPDPSL